MDIAILAKQCLKQWDAITFFVLARRLIPHLAMKLLREETKRREMNDLRLEYICEKGYKIEEMWECEWWQNFKTNEKIKNHTRFFFPTKDLSLLIFY